MAEQTKRRILVVDDERPVLDLIETLLTRAGFEVILADNVATAVLILRSTPLPDLVILDLMLPDISGLELLRQMRAKDVFDNLPVLVLSALADPEEIRQGLELGADRYLTKPYMAHNLVKTVRDLLQTGRRPAQP